jgi:hypothetical protein
VSARIIASALIAAALGILAPDARATQELTCQQIIAMDRFSGGKMGADELAKRLRTDVDTVRSCLAKKDPAADTHAAKPARK